MRAVSARTVRTACTSCVRYQAVAPPMTASGPHVAATATSSQASANVNAGPTPLPVERDARTHSSRLDALSIDVRQSERSGGVSPSSQGNSR